MGKPLRGNVRLNKETLRKLSPELLSIALGGGQSDGETEESPAPATQFLLAAAEHTRPDGTNTCAV